MKVGNQRPSELFIPKDIVTPKVFVDNPQGFDFLIRFMNVFEKLRRQLTLSLNTELVNT